MKNLRFYFAVCITQLVLYWHILFSMFLFNPLVVPKSANIRVFHFIFNLLILAVLPHVKSSKSYAEKHIAGKSLVPSNT